MEIETVWFFPPVRSTKFGSKVMYAKLPDIIIVIAYGQLLSLNLIQAAKKGALNLHPSLLPLYRGPSPIQTAILDNKQSTGTSLMLLDEKMDHGPILDQVEVHILETDTAKSLHDKLATISADLLLSALPKYLSGQLTPKQQDDSKASFSKILKRSDGQLNLNKDAASLALYYANQFPKDLAETKKNLEKVSMI